MTDYVSKKEQVQRAMDLLRNAGFVMRVWGLYDNPEVMLYYKGVEIIGKDGEARENIRFDMFAGRIEVEEDKKHSPPFSNDTNEEIVNLLVSIDPEKQISSYRAIVEEIKHRKTMNVWDYKFCEFDFDKMSDEKIGNILRDRKLIFTELDADTFVIKAQQELSARNSKKAK